MSIYLVSSTCGRRPKTKKTNRNDRRMRLINGVERIINNILVRINVFCFFFVPGRRRRGNDEIRHLINRENGPVRIGSRSEGRFNITNYIRGKTRRARIYLFSSCSDVSRALGARIRFPPQRMQIVFHPIPRFYNNIV